MDQRNNLKDTLIVFTLFFILALAGSLLLLKRDSLFGVKVSEVSYTKLSPSSVAISFKTSKPVTVKLNYGTTELYGVQTPETEVTSDHKIVLSGLLPQRDHNFQVVMTDEKGNESLSGNFLIPSN